MVVHSWYTAHLFVASVIGGGWFDNKESVGNSRCHSRYAVTDTAVAYPADPLTQSSKLYADCGHC